MNHTIYRFQYKKKKITLNYLKSAAKGFFSRGGGGVVGWCDGAG